MPRPPESAITEAIRLTKDEIVEDVVAGVVPADVETFGDLHGHVDANTYGGLCDESGPWADTFSDDEGVAAANEVQTAVDTWIKDGGIAAALAAAGADR